MSSPLHARFQVGSIRGGQIDYFQNERVFHTDDVSQKAKEARIEVKKSLQSYKAKPTWNIASTAGSVNGKRRQMPWDTASKDRDDRYYASVERDHHVTQAQERLHLIREGKWGVDEKAICDRWNCSTFVEPLKPMLLISARQKQQPRSFQSLVYMHHVLPQLKSPSHSSSSVSSSSSSFSSSSYSKTANPHHPTNYLSPIEREKQFIKMQRDLKQRTRLLSPPSSSSFSLSSSSSSSLPTISSSTCTGSSSAICSDNDLAKRLPASQHFRARATSSSSSSYTSALSPRLPPSHFQATVLMRDHFEYYHTGVYQVVTSNQSKRCWSCCLRENYNDPGCTKKKLDKAYTPPYKPVIQDDDAGENDLTDAS
eukprot:TRINITY_DN146_c0_g1_i1.p1 TRINITY_DN146_c0_g1~~TRINITY_DN146_c0_g1_i1.p1  ORF type:complete len:368 (-),score=90.54 TRINITY_DN146_c0_g1_i1:191-1294(-)